MAGTLVFFELLAGQYVARPNRILRPSRDPEMVYESTPGNWLGHAKYDVWRAPLYIVLDLLYSGSSRDAVSAPPGYTLYRIDPDGCRAPSTGPIPPRSDVVVLGSSQAFGMLVPAEESLPYLLEASLRARGHAGLSVASCGVIGHHLLQSLRTGERVRASKQPRLSVVVVRPWHLLEQFDYTQVLVPRNRALRWITDHSTLARLAYYIHRHENSQFDKPEVPAALLEARLDRYLAHMRDANVRSLFVLLDDGYDVRPKFDRVAAMLRQRGVPMVQVHTPINHPEYFIDRDQHWSITGARWATSQVVDAVDRELRLATVTPPR